MWLLQDKEGFSDGLTWQQHKYPANVDQLWNIRLLNTSKSSL